MRTHQVNRIHLSELVDGGETTWAAGEGGDRRGGPHRGADRLTRMHETLSRSQKLAGTGRRTVALSTAVEVAVADRRGTDPDATVDVDDGLWVRARLHLETAIGEPVGTPSSTGAIGRPSTSRPTRRPPGSNCASPTTARA
jgi:hypothetical protein